MPKSCSVPEVPTSDYLPPLDSAPGPKQTLFGEPAADSEDRLHLFGWNETAKDYPEYVPLASLIEAQVERTPQAIAVVSGNRQLTFQELNERANQLAHHLGCQGAGPDTLVGLCLNRSVDMIVALLAIIKSGAAYVPIDPLLPVARVRYLFEDSSVTMLVTEQALLSHSGCFNGNLTLLEDQEWRGRSTQNPVVPVQPNNLAYLIYTSGSTGKPKGVQIPRRALTNFLWAMRDLLRLTEADRVLAITTVSFDMAVLELWLPLLVGARIILATRDDAADGKLLRELIERYDITFMQATPITWRFLFLAGWKQKVDLQVICGAEPMPPDLAVQLVPAVKRLWNMYGPTETTVWSTGYVVTDPGAPILIGRPIANTRCYILDDQQQPVPMGTTGELYIAGDGLAIAYRNRLELTAAAFVPDPFVGGAARMYRTGDLARHHPDSNIECLGRVDHQVKLNGYRIELGEIESALREIPDIQDAVVALREDSPGAKRLVGYVVPAGERLPLAEEITRRLKLVLPSYMIPVGYCTLEKIPLSHTGKIDRKLLPVPDSHQRLSSEAYEAPRDVVEETLKKLWSEVLSIERIGVRDDYFDLGGDSLGAVRLIVKIREAFPDSTPSLATFLSAPTIEQFARIITGDGHGWSCLVALREGAGRAPFFCVHGAGGNWMSMRGLAMETSETLPFYCFQAVGLDGMTPPFSTVEETARHYLIHLRSIQPHGPYNLGGGCYGGLVAFEMACQLRQLGETIDVLALIDAENPAYSRQIPKMEALYFEMSFIARRTIHHLRQWKFIGSSGKHHYMGGRIKLGWRALKEVIGILREGKSAFDESEANVEKRPLDKSSDDFEATLEVVRQASVQAGKRFMPKPYDGHLMVFRAKQRTADPYSDRALGWGPVVSGGITTYQVEADHNGIFQMPAVAQVGGLLDAALMANVKLFKDGSDTT